MSIYLRCLCVNESDKKGFLSTISSPEEEIIFDTITWSVLGSLELYFMDRIVCIEMKGNV